MKTGRKKIKETKNDAVSKVGEFSYISMIQQYHIKQPFFYDRAKMWWLWDDKVGYWVIKDIVDILNNLYKFTGGWIDLTEPKIKQSVINALQMVGRMNEPLPFNKRWVQFEKTIFDLETKKTFVTTPKYMNANPIPWKLTETDATPCMDKIFEEWVGKEKSKILYEIIAYCCLSDYPLHNIFCLFGGGSNGKSQYQRILHKFVGHNNVCSSDLDLLSSNRFEVSKLYKKLVCTLGETNFGLMKNSGTLKKLCGQDEVSFEFKGKNAIDDINYATIIINSNSLPTTVDQSKGFFRRWMIVPFEKEFQQGPDPLLRIPDEEYNNLCRKITKILPVILKRGNVYGLGSVEDRKRAYILASNPLPFWLKEYCLFGSNLCDTSRDLYSSYCSYLKDTKKRKVSRKEFKLAMEDEGFFVEKTTRSINGELKNGWIYEGLTIKLDKKSDKSDLYDSDFN